MARGWTASAIALLLLQASIGAAQPVAAAAPTRERVLTMAREIMVAARYGTLITLGPDGQPQARLVDPLEPDAAFRVFVATNPLSRKVTEIRKDSRVTLLYFDTSRLGYVTAIGRAFEVRDEEKGAHRKKEWQAFFPAEKPEGYVLYRIVLSRLEVVSPRDGLNGDALTWRPEILEIK